MIGRRRRVASEAGGSMILVGVAAILMSPYARVPDVVGLPGAAVAYALVLGLLIFVLGPISGAHLNPAVTLAFASTNRFPVEEVTPYLIAQLTGGIAGALVVRVAETLTRLPAPLLPASGTGVAYGLEWVCSFVLMLAVMAIALDSRVSRSTAAVTAGAAISGASFLALSWSGGLLNPVRTFAYHSGGAWWRVVWVYWIGPITAMAAAANLYDVWRGRRAIHAIVAGKSVGLTGLIPSLVAEPTARKSDIG